MTPQRGALSRSQRLPRPSDSCLLILSLLLLSCACDAQSVAPCPSGIDYQQTYITNCYSAADKYGCMTMRASPYCGTEDLQQTKYSSCNMTVGAVMAQKVDCVSTLRTLTKPEDIKLAEKTCAMPYGEYISYLCAKPASCPGPNELGFLLPLATCLYSKPNTLSEKELDSYNPYACLQEEGGTEVQFCDMSKSLLRYFTSCDKTTYLVVNDILNTTTSSSSNCDDILRGKALNPYCQQSFGAAIEHFCTPGFCDTLIAGVGACIFIGAVAGAGVLLLLLCIIALVVRRRKRARDAPYLGSKTSSLAPISSMGGSASNLDSHASFSMMVAPAPQMQPFGSIRNMAPSPPGMMVMMTPPQQQHVQMLPPAPMFVQPQPAPVEEDADTRHRRQLIEFYEFHDPEREDVPDHVDKLMEKYDFRSIAKALKSKYGMLPPGWEEELAKPVLKKKDKAAGANAPPGLGSSGSGSGSNDAKVPNTAAKFAKYNEMARLGLPEAAIVQQMERDGVNQDGWVYCP